MYQNKVVDESKINHPIAFLISVDGRLVVIIIRILICQYFS
jgi:hypothetical protein